MRWAVLSQCTKEDSMGYHGSVKRVEQSYISLSGGFSTERVWRAAITVDRDGKTNDHVDRRDFKRQQDAKRWLDDHLKRYQHFYSERGFHFDQPYQLRLGKESIGHFGGPTTVKQAAMKLPRPDGAKHHLWITTDESPVRGQPGKRYRTGALLRWYDTKGDPIDTETPVTWRKRRTT